MSKPTIAQLKSRLHFSASALKTYLQCPWKFKLQYVQGARPEFRPSGMVLGRAVHAALARYHLALMNEQPFGADALIGTFEEVLDRELGQEMPVQFKDGEGPASMGETGRSLLEVYHSAACFSAKSF